MAKPGRKVKKANHGARPACSRPRKQRHKVKTYSSGLSRRSVSGTNLWLAKT
jgi:hypothetical protein